MCVILIYTFPWFMGFDAASMPPVNQAQRGRHPETVLLGLDPLSCPVLSPLSGLCLFLSCLHVCAANTWMYAHICSRLCVFPVILAAASVYTAADTQRVSWDRFYFNVQLHCYDNVLFFGSPLVSWLLATLSLRPRQMAVCPEVELKYLYYIYVYNEALIILSFNGINRVCLRSRLRVHSGPIRTNRCFFCSRSQTFNRRFLALV